MKKFYLLLMLLVPCASLIHAQGFGLPAGFDLKTFQKNEELAVWLTQYDSAVISVTAFDHLTGKDFICYPDKKGWKVVAGTVDSSGFKADAAYYLIDAKKTVTSSNKKFDTLQVYALGRAVFNAKQQLAKLTAKAPAGWRTFVKINDDKSINVWALCDGDPNTSVWYGPECTWYFAADGRHLNTSKIINRTPLMAGKNGATMYMSCPTDKMPTVGTIYLARKYMLTYPEVNISYKTGTSTLRYNTAEKTYAWEHLAN